MQLFRTLLFLITVLIIGGLGGLGYVSYVLNTPFDRGSEQTLYIPRGSGLTEISQGLSEQKAMPSFYGSQWIFMTVAKLKKLPLKAGEYQVLRKTSLQDIIDQMVLGKMILHKVTFPEGITTAEAVQILNEQPYLKGTIKRDLSEGTLAPDTYMYLRDDSRERIIDQMLKLQQTNLKNLWDKRQANLPFKTPYEALIMASVVEKETGLSTERPHIASVFINRLRQGIRLQSDPTVSYGITLGKSSLNRSLTKSDLINNTPYNTYTIQGLPPTPIANAGKACIEAVLNPLQTEDLYFVADGTGGHTFAKTLEDHNANVRQWRQIEQDRKSKSLGSQAVGSTPSYSIK